MTKEHKRKENGTPIGQDALGQEEDKIFTFDKENPSKTENLDTPGLDENLERIAELETSLGELKDKQLRLLAEFDNYKKRTMRERLELVNSASRDVILQLLPVLDDFDRAKKNADDPKSQESFSEGVTMVYNRLYTILQSIGLKTMDSDGAVFDPDQHDAITEVPVQDENLKGKVLDTIEKGYLLHDKIIRHAKVVVGS